MVRAVVVLHQLLSAWSKNTSFSHFMFQFVSELSRYVMAVGSAELGDSWMIVSIGVSIISFSLSLKASRRSDEPDLRLETFSAGTDSPKNIFLVTTEKKGTEVLSLYCFSNQHL